MYNKCIIVYIYLESIMINKRSGITGISLMAENKQGTPIPFQFDDPCDDCTHWF